MYEDSLRVRGARMLHLAALHPDTVLTVAFPMWFLIVGAVLIAMALSSTVLKRLPLTASMFYLVVGAALGPAGLELLQVDVLDDSVVLERLTEIAVIVSLFTAGLKLRLPLADWRWRPPALLATLAMGITVCGIAVLAAPLLGLSIAGAVLLGAVLAPTDPVLASDVQVESEHDAEPVRFGLTGEAGLNDGTAFPFVMLGLGLMGSHELGEGGGRWLAVDVLWAVAAGLGVGTICGAGVGRLVLRLRRARGEVVGTDEFLALGLIALSYGSALAIGSYGFLAVFAAGVSVRRIEREESTGGMPASSSRVSVPSASDPRRDPATPAHMARAVLAFNEQLERLGEVAVVIALGAMATTVSSVMPGLLLAAALFGAIRPAATTVALLRSNLSGPQCAYIAWFGVRGAGSVYYLMFALNHGLDDTEARLLVDATLVVVVASIVVHGISVTPLMRRYTRNHRGRACRDGEAPPRSQARTAHLTEVRVGVVSLGQTARADLSRGLA